MVCERWFDDASSDVVVEMGGEDDVQAAFGVVVRVHSGWLSDTSVQLVVVEKVDKRMGGCEFEQVDVQVASDGDVGCWMILNW